MPTLSVQQLRDMRRRGILPPSLVRVLEEEEGRGPLAAAKPAKYRSRLFEDGEHILFDSEWEADVRDQLELQRLRRLIDRWAYAPRFVLQRDPLRPRTMITYRPDFIVWPPEDEQLPWHVIDAKGVRTQLFMVKVRLWKMRMPEHKLLVWTRKDGLREL